MYFAIYVLLMYGQVEVLIDEGPYYSYNECQIAVLREVPALQLAKKIEPLKIICQSFDLADA